MAAGIASSLTRQARVHAADVLLVGFARIHGVVRGSVQLVRGRLRVVRGSLGIGRIHRRLIGELIELVGVWLVDLRVLDGVLVAVVAGCKRQRRRPNHYKSQFFHRFPFPREGGCRQAP